VTFISNNYDDDELKVNHFSAPGKNESFLTDNVSFVTQDNNRDFWIGTDGGLYRINEMELQEGEPVLVEGYRNSIYSDDAIEFLDAVSHSGEVWFGTRNAGLISYDPDTRLFSRYSEDPVIGSIDEISVLQSTGENLWIGTSVGNLIHYNNTSGKFSTYKFDDDRSGERIQKIYVDNFGQVWLITEKFGITRFDPLNGKFKYYQLTPTEFSNLTDDERIIIKEDSKNQFWLGGQNMGIQKYDRGKDVFIRYLNNPRDPSSLQSNVVECIEEDREGNLWIGTNWFGKGLVRLVTLDEAFEYIRPVQSPKNKVENVIRALFVDSRGYTWAGTKNGQIYIYDGDLQPYCRIDESTEKSYSGYNVYSITEDKHGYIWLCTKGAGIYKSNQSLHNRSIDYTRLTYSNFRHDPGVLNSLGNDNAYDLLVDAMDRIWVGTYGGGLNMIEKDATGKYVFHHFTTENSSLTSDKIRDLFLDSRGRMWLATTYGLNYVDIYKSSGEFEFKTILSNPRQGNGLSYNDIIMVIEDSNGHIWLGTSGGGVNEIRNPASDRFEIRYFNHEIGLRDDYILSLTEDVYGFIWIGTNNGLSRYNPVTGEIKNFDDKIGLPENFFSERTAITSPNGKVLFGTINGFYSIHANQITEENVNPTISLTGFQLNNTDVFPRKENSPLEKAISYCNDLVLKHDQSNFSLEFSLLSFRSPASNQYSYLLEGFNNTWSQISSEHKATFTNIPPGSYTFRVKGFNSDRTEYDSEASLDITILPPIWNTKLAYFIYFLLFLGLVFLAIRISMRFFRLKNEVKIEKRVAESKLRFFTNISHEIRTPLTLILGPLDKLIVQEKMRPEVKQQLAVVHRNSKRLLRMVNQILDFRKVQNEQMTLKIQEIELIPFFRQIYESFEALAKQKNIRFSLIYDERDEHMVVWGDIQKLDIVFFNLLSNAFKFTRENGQISIIVTYDTKPGDSVKIIVRDTGVGIEKDKLDLIFDRFFVSHTAENDEYQGTGIGLSLSLEYVKLHKGEMKADSVPGKGTDFTVHLLTGTDHFPENVIVKSREAYSYTPKVREIDEVEEIVEPVLREPSDSQKDGYHILVVEDDVEMCSYLRGLLETKYKVSIAKDGKDGWEQAKEIIPDLIISDNMMPVMSGIELTRKIKDEFSTCHIPVIMLSSKSEVESQVEGLQTGAEAYIPKPFNDKLLLSYVQSFINQREKIKELFNNRIELKPDEVHVTSKDKDFINEVIHMIDENMGDPEFNVEKLAARVFVSRTLFYKKIKGITGYQPVELIRMLRLKKAAQYIESGEYNISEVAYMVGYNDIRYFSTSFKKQFGVSPSKYNGNSNS